MPHPAFDRSRLRIQPLARRQHDLDLSAVRPLDAPLPEFSHPSLPVLGRRLVEARQHGSARLLLLIGHNPTIHVTSRAAASSGYRTLRERLSERFPTAAFALIAFAIDDWAKVFGLS